MKKILLSMAGILLIGFGSLTAQAGSNTGTFPVNINLTSACAVNTGATTATFNYTSMQIAAATFATTFTIQCTNTLPITSVTLDLNAVTDAKVNLAYTLAVAGVPATANGLAQTINLTGNMPANQAGTCAGASCTNAGSANMTRTITVAY